MATKTKTVTTNKSEIVDLRPGDTVRVHYKIREGGKDRIQIFEGLVIESRVNKAGAGRFTVRKIASGVGVERMFVLPSPWVSKIERIKSGKVRRARLNFVRRFASTPKNLRFKHKNRSVETWLSAVVGQVATAGEDNLVDPTDTDTLSAEPNPSDKPDVESAVIEAAESVDSSDDDTAQTESGAPGRGDGGSVSPKPGDENPSAKSAN